MKKLVVPTINLNGNEARDLIDRLVAVLNAVRALQSSLANASDVVHGRNFQTVADPAVYRQARDAWGELLQTVEDIHKDVETLALGIQRQENDRGRSITHAH